MNGECYPIDKEIFQKTYDVLGNREKGEGLKMIKIKVEPKIVICRECGKAIHADSEVHTLKDCGLWHLKRANMILQTEIKNYCAGCGYPVE